MPLLFDRFRKHNNVARNDVVVPLRDRAAALQHHADRHQAWVHHATCPDIGTKVASAQREITDLSVHQPTVECAWRQLHDLQIRATHRLSKIFRGAKPEAVDVERDWIG
ncbi:hypothetical protein EOC94_17860 [Mesorhizobium sp. M6A.T.Ce.TU.016.01.1.1]|nr:hypothetical protein EOC94_17860 [Mesorhizobium sp. M6A.T.Ce.TU.016.01.1.1]